MIVVVPKRADEVVHVYTYYSSGVPWPATLSLRQKGESRTCTFMTKGHCSDDHGYWFEDNGVLKACFNYRWQGPQSRDLPLPLHPSVLYRMDGGWFGEDDKACQIRLEHVRSIIRVGTRWSLTSEL